MQQYHHLPSLIEPIPSVICLGNRNILEVGTHVQKRLNSEDCVPKKLWKWCMRLCIIHSQSVHLSQTSPLAAQTVETLNYKRATDLHCTKFRSRTSGKAEIRYKIHLQLHTQFNLNSQNWILVLRFSNLNMSRAYGNFQQVI